jgi:hypothetical protein
MSKEKKVGKLLEAYGNNISNILKKHLPDGSHTLPDRNMCMVIYQEIFAIVAESVTHLVIKDKQLISEQAVNLVSQMLYDSVELSTTSDERLDPTIFTQRPKLATLNNEDLAIFATGFAGSPFAAPFIMELKRRVN